ncbi:MAG: YifB family Mg chelatase-like AAA ATPase [Oscillospiraceae bacterium]|nr:YifB family Mg chelatase-like AAA ATPase [Oscillospiraceae bacterium]
MFSSVNSMGLMGLRAYPVQAEVDLSQSMPAFEIVGLPGAAVKESRDRVRSAIRNCGMAFPLGKIIVNLSPADVRKDGALYDLPIFMGILTAAGMLEADLSDSAFLGELSLSGEVRRVNGVLPLVLQAKEMGLRNVFIPEGNAAEGAVVKGINVYPLAHVQQLLDHYFKGQPLETAKPVPTEPAAADSFLDFADVKGQSGAKRALEVAAAGGHNLLMIGSPGAGKSMLAKRIPSILPEMTFEESIETTKIHSVAGLLSEQASLITQRPFRAPHHTISPAGLSGGGTVPRPGEISLAHNGVLFLDELPEFSRDAMEVLRQPIEDGQVTISRVSGSLTYPCSMMVVAAMNPCPCGYYGHPVRECTCSQNAVGRYLSKVSGPLLDRLDLHIEVAPVEYEHLVSTQKEESSASIRQRVNAARHLQQQRYQGLGFSCNANLPAPAVNRFCPMDDGATALLSRAFDTMGLSARAYDRILKVSRTIADLDSAEVISRRHIAEAVQYRSLDRKYWNR